jgi:magnesium transporter
MVLDLKNLLQDLDEARILELREKFDDFYPQDIAEEYPKLEEREKELLLEILSDEQISKFITELPDSEIKDFFDKVSDDEITRFTDSMALDDAADILALLDDKRMLNIMSNIQKPVALKELMSFDADTCGGIMTPGFISVRADLKIGAALRYVRLKAKETANEIMYVYVTKKFGELVGVISLRQLFLANDNDQVSDYLIEDIISVNVDEDQEVASDLISKYRFLAIPVVNSNEQLVGIITIDDVVDVIEEEATEDIYQSSGINVESDVESSDYLLTSYFGAFKSRTPWLIITLLGQYAASVLIAKYETTIVSIPIAISFMPLLSGLSGNIGNQSTTIIVRGLYTGGVDQEKSLKILSHEVITSFLIGLTCALITGLLSFYFYKNMTLSILIGSSLVISMMLAVILGTLTPIIFRKFDLDPAAASGPLITTGVDMLSFFVYLSLITKFINQLV